MTACALIRASLFLAYAALRLVLWLVFTRGSR